MSNVNEDVDDLIDDLIDDLEYDVATEDGDTCTKNLVIKILRKCKAKLESQAKQIQSLDKQVDSLEKQNIRVRLEHLEKENDDLRTKLQNATNKVDHEPVRTRNYRYCIVCRKYTRYVCSKCSSDESQVHLCDPNGKGKHTCFKTHHDIANNVVWK